MSKKFNIQKFTDDLNSSFGISSEWLKPLDELFDNIRNRIQLYVDDNIRLREENEKLKSEHYKDKELERLNEELEKIKEDLYRGFPIFEDEDVEIKKWQKNHTEKMHPKSPKKIAKSWAEGPDYNYVFSPFELGISQKCYCETCRKKAFKEAKGDLEKYNKLLEKYDVEFDFTRW